jgi:hypothetical protein
MKGRMRQLSIRGSTPNLAIHISRKYFFEPTKKAAPAFLIQEKVLDILKHVLFQWKPVGGRDGKRWPPTLNKTLFYGHISLCLFNVFCFIFHGVTTQKDLIAYGISEL